MANERKTERITREILSELDYYNNKIIVEEQKSDSNIISELLSSASKSGNGAGYPEFIIRKNNSDVIIVIECKANTKEHESNNKNNPKKYAVDGVLHYASFLKNKFNVIAIAISGEKKEDLKMSFFQWSKNEKRYFPKKYSEFMNYKNYYELFHSNDNINLTEKQLLEYAKKLHNEMRDEAKLKEAEKPLLVACLLLALDNGDFVNEYKSITNPERLAKRILEAIKESLNESNLLDSKINTLINEFNFITTHTYLLDGTIDNQNPSHDNNSLHKFLVDIESKVYPFVKKTNNIDIIGQFYSEFLRYTGGDGKGLGIVLTPTHITELFCELAEVNKNSKVLDICTGTGGFLISAMEKMLKDDPTVSEIDSIYKNNLVGIETQTNMYALSASNMIIRGDGKANLLQENCFNENLNLNNYKCNIGLINPPYSQKKLEEKELNFVKKLLDSLEVGGIGIAIIPLSCTNSDNDIRQNILEKHTLKAVTIMPSDLFKGANTHTCIMIFEAHKPHNSNTKSWFSLWDNDGFVNAKNKRIDINNKWKTIKEEWITNYRDKTIKKGISILKEVDYNSEWSAYAYVETNYLNITINNFKSTIKDYLIFKTQIKDNYDLISYILENQNLKDLFANNQNDLKPINTSKWKEFKIEDIFIVKGSKTTPKKVLENYGDGKYPYVTTRATNNAVDSYYNHFTDEGNILTIDSATIGYCSYQEDKFSASDHVEVLKPKFKLNIYRAMFFQTLLNKEQFRYSYGRKFNQGRIKQTKLLLPIKDNEIDFKYIDKLIKKIYNFNLDKTDNKS